MSRWQFDVYRNGEDEPYASHPVYDERFPGGVPAALVSELALSVQVAAEDLRAVRIELRREGT